METAPRIVVATAFSGVTLFDFPFQIVYHKSMSLDIIAAEVAQSIAPLENVSGMAYSADQSDSIIINRGIYDYPGHKKTLEGGLVFSLEEGMPLVTAGSDEVVTRSSHRHIFRDLSALIFDFNLWCLSRAESALDLVLGDLLARLKEGNLNRLGYVRIGDFCLNELGMKKSLAYELIRQSLMLGKLPVVREAYENGHINRSALREILKVVREETQAEWIAKAGELSVRGLQDLVKRALEKKVDRAESRFACNDDGFTDCGGFDRELQKGCNVSVKVPLSLSAKWDYALGLFRKMEGAELPVTEFLEALLAEYVSGWENDEVCPPDQSVDSANGERELPALLEDAKHAGSAVVDGSYVDPEREKMRAIYRETRKALEEMSHYWDFLPWKPVAIRLPDSASSSCGNDPVRMADRLRRVIRLRQAIAFHQGILLLNINNRNLCKDMLFSSLGHYCEERFGISRSTAYARIKMARTFLEHPEIQERFLAGEFSLEQVRLLSRVYRGGAQMMRDWIDYARRVPAVRLSRKVEEFLREQEINERASRRCRLLARKEDIENGEICTIDGVEYGPVESTGDGGFEERLICRVRGAGDVSLEAGQRAFQCGGLENVKDEQPVRKCGTDEERGWQVVPGSEENGKPFVRMCGMIDGPVVPLCELNAGKENSWQSCPTCPGSGYYGQTSGGCEVSSTSIRFFIPRSLYPIWDQAAQLYVIRSRSNGKEPVLTDFIGGLLEHFLNAWETREKRSFHNNVLERDGFVCQAPGCECRRNIEAHHITYRSHGGSNNHSNGLSLCAAHHRACVHTGYIVINGEAPYNITIVMKNAGEGGASVVFRNGERVLPDDGRGKML